MKPYSKEVQRKIEEDLNNHFRLIEYKRKVQELKMRMKK